MPVGPIAAAGAGAPAGSRPVLQIARPAPVLRPAPAAATGVGPDLIWACRFRR